MKRESFGICPLCDEPILPGDAVSPSTFDGVEVHHECGFRAVAGGANHLLKLCTCCGGKLPPDPPHLSKRDAARWAIKVYRWIEELRVWRDQQGEKKGPHSGP